MQILKEFREFAVKGNAVDLAVGVIIGAAFGKIVSSIVEDLIMPPIGRLTGGLDFSNMYVSLSDKVDAANVQRAADIAEKARAIAATQPGAAGGSNGSASVVTQIFDTATRLPLVDARKLGPVLAYGNFITTAIQFLIVAFCVFLLVKLINRLKRQEQVAPTAPPPTPEDVLLLREIRDSLKK